MLDINKRDIKEIVIHCSDSEFGNASWIRDIHVNEFGWSDIGYHFVVLNGQVRKGEFYDFSDGQIEVGRPIEIQGAHVKSFNANTIGICLIGSGKYTVKQLHSIDWLLLSLMKEYSVEPGSVRGHYEYPTAKGKTCPIIDMKKFREHLKFIYTGKNKII